MSNSLVGAREREEEVEAAVLLDDIQKIVDGAIAIGMKGITFRNNAQAIAELEALLTD